MLVETCCCKTFSYICNIKKQSEIANYLEKLKKTSPQIKFSVTCYHYRRRHINTRENYDNYERNSSRIDEEKVISHQAEEYFRYNSWMDNSKNIYSLDYIQSLPMTRL